MADGRGGPGEFGDMRGDMGGGGFGHALMGQLDFAELDADGSGAITIEDLQANAESRFAEADANGDGQLDQGEIAARITARIEERGLETRSRGGVRWTPEMDERRIAWMAEGMIIRKDADGNGTIGADEAAPDADRLARLIDRFDANGDDAVSAEEFEQFAEAGRGRFHRRGGHDDRGRRGG
ncbi:MAG: EF-hand domain-containing protein [Paracoccaceae bacterium]|nr:EF-hand domain-containing protein [Paracoccaceae bacterium]